MTHEVTEHGEMLVVSLAGEIDLEQAPAVRRLLLDSVTRRRDVVVDLSGVLYIDSSGIANLVEALQAANRQGTGFSLAAVSPQALRVLELARLDKVFAILRDAGAARPGTV